MLAINLGTFAVTPKEQLFLDKVNGKDMKQSMLVYLKIKQEYFLDIANDYKNKAKRVSSTKGILKNKLRNKYIKKAEYFESVAKKYELAVKKLKSTLL